MGFRYPFNRPIRTYQGQDCIYPPAGATVQQATQAKQ